MLVWLIHNVPFPRDKLFHSLVVAERGGERKKKKRRKKDDYLPHTTDGIDGIGSSSFMGSSTHANTEKEFHGTCSMDVPSRHELSSTTAWKSRVQSQANGSQS